MKSETIFMNKNQFLRFVKSMPKLGLKRKPNDKSAFPLDFVVHYNNRYTLNFEYLSGMLEFYLISNKDTKTRKAIKNANLILLEIKEKIKKVIK